MKVSGNDLFVTAMKKEGVDTNKMGQFFSGSTHNLLVIRTLLPL